MAWLADTNLLVYRHDPRFPDKQARATELLRSGVETGEVRVAHQAVVEFVAAVSRPAFEDRAPLLGPDDARREAEELLSVYEILYPVEPLVRLALRGAAAYQLSWFDAHMWAYAEFYGLETLYSEDYQDGRLYGTVRCRNPF